MMVLGVQSILVLVIFKVVVGNPHQVDGKQHEHHHPDHRNHEVHEVQQETQHTIQLNETHYKKMQIDGDVIFPLDEAPGPVINEVVEGREQQCNSLPNPGECRGAFPRYYFDSKKNQCNCYLWGGCDDDAFDRPQRSSWLTLEDCHKSCNPENKEPGNTCKQLFVPVKPFEQTTHKIATVPDTSHINDEDFLNSLG